MRRTNVKTLNIWRPASALSKPLSKATLLLWTLSLPACGSSWFCKAQEPQSLPAQPQVLVIHEGALTVLPKETVIFLPDGRRLQLKAAPMWLVSEAWVNQQHEALAACLRMLQTRPVTPP